ncbi:hypothetical protein V1477_014649 [Vespula maculifrons]|uniref:Uncharacterized protein n=1 Tax=Vespula maculifrons TaxID=7453 RepID=A0ABD2BJ21_VESMC
MNIAKYLSLHLEWTKKSEHRHISRYNIIQRDIRYNITQLGVVLASTLLPRSLRDATIRNFFSRKMTKTTFMRTTSLDRDPRLYFCFRNETLFIKIG